MHSYLAHASSICVIWLNYICDRSHGALPLTWLIHPCDTTLSFVWHVLLNCDTQFIHICHVMYLHVWLTNMSVCDLCSLARNVWHDGITHLYAAFICVKGLIHSMHSYGCHDSFMTHDHLCDWYNSTRNVCHYSFISYVWNDSFIWHMWGYSFIWYMSRDSFMTNAHVCDWYNSTRNFWRLALCSIICWVL